LLLVGFVCVFVGTALLYLGGRRSAAVKLKQWRKQAGELGRLWISDMLRPLRRRRLKPVPVLSP
jgi:hypothetical protein